MRWNCLKFDFLKSQVLEYDGSAWTEKGRMKRGRGSHAVVEADFLAFCPAGNKGKSQFSLKEQVYETSQELRMLSSRMSQNENFLISFCAA